MIGKVIKRRNKDIVIVRDTVTVTEKIHPRLVCCGSSLFLKSLYGTGYYLTLIKSPERPEERELSSVASSVDTAASVDEGISDLSTHETILNPSTGNER
jgi:hypothetical protein